MKLFISHSSKDEFIVDLFVEKILIAGCGITDGKVFCTSIEGLGIKTGIDFRSHIRERLKDADYSFLLISKNYMKSDICLNEMGASWALETIEVKPFIFPNMHFNEMGTLYSVKQAAKLNDSYALDELFEELKERYNISKSTARWNKAKQEFLDLSEAFFKNDNNLSPTPEEYFSQFLRRGVSFNGLLLDAQPTLTDCKRVFKKDFYSKMFMRYSIEFDNLSEIYIEPLDIKYKRFNIVTNSTEDLLVGKNLMAGGMKMAALKGAFNYGIVFYKVQFIDSYGNFGTSYSVFCYLNDRWVFFPKPWWIPDLKLDSEKPF